MLILHVQKQMVPAVAPHCTMLLSDGEFNDMIPKLSKK